MNRRELCDQIAVQTGVPVSEVDRVLTGLTYVVPAAVKRGDRVGLVGFGTWEQVARRARKARNPRTGTMVKVKATKIPRFRPGAPFKQAVAGGKLTKPAALQTTRTAKVATATRARGRSVVTPGAKAGVGNRKRGTALNSTSRRGSKR